MGMATTSRRLGRRWGLLGGEAEAGGALAVHAVGGEGLQLGVHGPEVGQRHAPQQHLMGRPPHNRHMARHLTT